MFEYFANRGSMNGLSFNNGWAKWYTLYGSDTIYNDGSILNVLSAEITMHRVKLSDTSWNWCGLGGRANWGFASAAASAEHLSGISRIGSNWKIYPATQTGRVFYGNQYVKTLGIIKIGNIPGKVSFGIGEEMDIYGLVEWSKDRNSHF